MKPDYTKYGEAVAREVHMNYDPSIDEFMRRFAINQYDTIRKMQEKAAEYRSTIAELHDEIRRLETALANSEARYVLTTVFPDPEMANKVHEAWVSEEQAIPPNAFPGLYPVNSDDARAAHVKINTWLGDANEYALLDAQAEAGIQINNMDLAKEIQTVDLRSWHCSLGEPLPPWRSIVWSNQDDT